MIAIINIGNENKAGETKYQVKVNSQLITTFFHKRSDGMAICLEKASKAVEKQKHLELFKLLKQFET